MAVQTAQVPRSVVLVHGLWSCPADWEWVAAHLRSAGVRVVAVDLPSHSSPRAGLPEDGAAVRAAIRDCEAPTVVAAWSAGSSSMDLGAEGEAGVARLVYVATYPTHPDGEPPEPQDWIDDDPMIRRLPDATFVLDTDLWLAAESHLFDSRLVTHLRRNRRRPASLRLVTETSSGRAWTTVPFTVVLGQADELVPAAETASSIAELSRPFLGRAADVRVVDSDHFVTLRLPELVAEILLEPVSWPSPARGVHEGR